LYKNKFFLTFNFRKQALPVVDALNDLGATPWVVNGTMLGHLETVFQMSLEPGSQAQLVGIAIIICTKIK
jgi:hypothetical protein